MATTIESLRNLGLKVNDKLPSSNNIGNVINEIANDYTGGGGGGGGSSTGITPNRTIAINLEGSDSGDSSETITATEYNAIVAAPEKYIVELNVSNIGDNQDSFKGLVVNTNIQAYDGFVLGYSSYYSNNNELYILGWGIGPGEEEGSYMIAGLFEKKTINYQDTLVSGTNIKTINNQSILGGGNLNVGGISTVKLNNVSVTSGNTATINTLTDYNATTNKVATAADIINYIQGIWGTNADTALMALSDGTNTYTGASAIKTFLDNISSPTLATPSGNIDIITIDSNKIADNKNFFKNSINCSRLFEKNQCVTWNNYYKLYNVKVSSTDSYATSFDISSNVILADLKIYKLTLHFTIADLSGFVYTNQSYDTNKF